MPKTCISLSVISLFHLCLAAAAFGQAGTTAPASPGLNNVFNPAPPVTFTGNSSIVVAVHGYDSNPARWADGMVSSILSTVPNDSEDGWTPDWSQDAVATGNFGPAITQIINAQLQGQYVAHMLLTNGNYTSIHFLGHSLGGRVIETAATILSQTSLHPTIQTTFLDPYTPYNWNLIYGSTSTYSDEIVNTSDYLNTNTYLANAFDVDVTPAGNPSATFLQLHAWPYQWYQNTVNAFGPSSPSYAGLGYGLSLEQGGNNWPSGNPRRGQVDVMDKAGTAVASITSTPQPMLQNALTLNPGAIGAFIAKSDNTTVGKNLISMATSNSGFEWINLAFNTTASENFVDFKFDFSTSEDGALSMRVDNTLYWAGLDQFALTNQWEDSGKIMIANLSAGMHVLSYRLDSGPSDGGTSVELMDINAGFLAVPEPAALALLIALPPAITARRRCKQTCHNLVH